MGKRHRKPVHRRQALWAQHRREVAFWGVFAVALVTAAALYEATEYRAEHLDHSYVSRYVPADAERFVTAEVTADVVMIGADSGNAR